MPRKTLTDRALKALKPARKPYDVMDSVVPGFGVRVLDRQVTCVLIARFPGSRNPTRRALGTYGELTLEAARAKARKWLELLSAGKDPSVEVARAKREQLRRHEAAFGAVCERYIAEAVIGPDPQQPLQRRWRETARDIRRDLSRWERWPIRDIGRQDFIALLRETKQRGLYQAHKVWVHVRCVFSWAVQDGSYALAGSPCDHIVVAKVVGAKKARARILNDSELKALWKSVMQLGYPHGPVYQLLILAGLRLNEVVQATWREFNLAERTWLIPSARMKGRDGKARPHLVPLTAEVLQILETVPRFDGDFVFTTTGGRRPIHLPKVQKKLDGLMLAELRAMAAQCGDDPDRIVLVPWRNHDIRRTVRSNLARLRIADPVAEAVLGHARPGILGVYDLHSYRDEKLAALQAWSNLLHSIIEQKPPNVVALKSKKSK